MWAAAGPAQLTGEREVFMTTVTFRVVVSLLRRSVPSDAAARELAGAAGMSVREARPLLSRLPSMVAWGLGDEEADALVERLVAVGAKVRLVEVVAETAASDADGQDQGGEADGEPEPLQDQHSGTSDDDEDEPAMESDSADGEDVGETGEEEARPEQEEAEGKGRGTAADEARETKRVGIPEDERAERVLRRRRVPRSRHHHNNGKSGLIWLALLFALTWHGQACRCADEGRSSEPGGVSQPDAGRRPEKVSSPSAHPASTPAASPELPEASNVVRPCDGGLLDLTSGLCWQNPAPDMEHDWTSAEVYCKNLSLGGHSPGSWHLPTVGELRSLIRGCTETAKRGSCGFTDSCLSERCQPRGYCLGCEYGKGPGTGSGGSGTFWPVGFRGQVGGFWSSSSPSSELGGSSRAFIVDFDVGSVVPIPKDAPAYYVRCVHRGP